MSFQVEPGDLRAYAAQLQEAYRDVADAKTYVAANGNLTFHQLGLIGLIAGRHTALMAQLDEMLGHLLRLTDESHRALTAAAARYEATDDQAAARVDASYPAAPRPPVFRG
jgi:hypothetical protein